MPYYPPHIKTDKQKKEFDKMMEEEARREQAFEMRAAFGPGTTVVNVFTGETFDT